MPDNRYTRSRAGINFNGRSFVPFAEINNAAPLPVGGAGYGGSLSYRAPAGVRGNAGGNAYYGGGPSAYGDMPDQWNDLTAGYVPPPPGAGPQVQLNPRSGIAGGSAGITPQVASSASGSAGFYGTHGGYGYQRDAQGNVSRIPRAELVRDRTGDMIGRVGGTAANALLPGAGLIAGPLAKWGSKMFRNMLARRNTPDTLTREQVAGAGVGLRASPNDPFIRDQRSGANLGRGMGGTYLDRGQHQVGDRLTRGAQMQRDMGTGGTLAFGQEDELTMGPSTQVTDPAMLQEFADRSLAGHNEWKNFAQNQYDFGGDPLGGEFQLPARNPSALSLAYRQALERRRAGGGGTNPYLLGPVPVFQGPMP